MTPAGFGSLDNASNGDKVVELTIDCQGLLQDLVTENPI
jgi:hypothetical protein